MADAQVCPAARPQIAPTARLPGKFFGDFEKPALTPATSHRDLGIDRVRRSDAVRLTLLNIPYG